MAPPPSFFSHFFPFFSLFSPKFPRTNSAIRWLPGTAPGLTLLPSGKRLQDTSCPSSAPNPAGQGPSRPPQSCPVCPSKDNLLPSPSIPSRGGILLNCHCHSPSPQHRVKNTILGHILGVKTVRGFVLLSAGQWVSKAGIFGVGKAFERTEGSIIPVLCVLSPL